MAPQCEVLFAMPGAEESGIERFGGVVGLQVQAGKYGGHLRRSAQQSSGLWDSMVALRCLLITSNWKQNVPAWSLPELIAGRHHAPEFTRSAFRT